MIAVALVAPAAGARFFAPIEQFGARLAKRKGLSVAVVGIAAVLIRVSMLAFVPVPIPHVQDEFSYLLAADTFAHGRLTNPVPPMPVYFEAIHVNVFPTYMSKYLPAQGAVLAIGQIFGNPWIGVVLSVGAMCGAIVWMLQGWLPAQWALLGGVLVIFHIGIFSYWMNSYWGGAVAAIGGALVIGALPRVMRFRRARDAILLGLGAAILANSRPFEGLIFCLPVFAWLIIWLGSSKRPTWSETSRRIILPMVAVLVAAALFIGYYNWRGTGNALVFPYNLNSSTYMSAPDLLWQKVKPPLQYSNPQFESFYTGVSRTPTLFNRADSFSHALRTLRYDAMKYVGLFLWPELCIPLLAVPWLLFDGRTRFLVIQFILCFFGFLLVNWFSPHYAAPLTATSFAIVTQGLRHIRRWRLGHRNIGIGVSRAVVVCAVLLAPFHRSYRELEPSLANRARLAAQLNSLAGDQLVIVKYSRDHDSTLEWVYNKADIDHAHVIWARDIPGVSREPLVNYYRGRHVWVVDAGSAIPHLSPYSEP